MADDYATLKPLKACADILASKGDWGPLYDRAVLQDTAVPCAALVCYEDLYVDRVFSEETAALLGDQMRIWVTNEFQHSGLSDDPARVWKTLTGMNSGEVMIPSP
jgi:hypothetical protein